MSVDRPAWDDLNERVYKYACDIVDSWSFETMKEYAETKIIDELLDKVKISPFSLHQEMEKFYSQEST